MSNFTRVKANCLRAAADDLSVALDLACHEIVRLHGQTSAGYRREKPQKPLAIEPKTHPAAIVIEGEPGTILQGVNHRNPLWKEE